MWEIVGKIEAAISILLEAMEDGSYEMESEEVEPPLRMVPHGALTSEPQPTSSSSVRDSITSGIPQTGATRDQPSGSTSQTKMGDIEEEVWVAMRQQGGPAIITFKRPSLKQSSGDVICR